jgi:gentisate 1,2-dioxygenase
MLRLCSSISVYIVSLAGRSYINMYEFKYMLSAGCVFVTPPWIVLNKQGHKNNTLSRFYLRHLKLLSGLYS